MSPPGVFVEDFSIVPPHVLRTRGVPWPRAPVCHPGAIRAPGGPDGIAGVRSRQRLGRSRVTVHHTRARLIYGEWLRRQNRRVDARVQLKAAFHALDAMGARAFAGRAERELPATGETVHKRTEGPRGRLTPQETQIAQLACDGQTNPEIAARLFVSHRTVEWHLRKVFAKLDIASRKEVGPSRPRAPIRPDAPRGRPRDLHGREPRGPRAMVGTHQPAMPGPSPQERR
ncbi:LuxR C-terminal-related transcriptional regulator [Streptosporangium sp. NPDC051023]|uniref:helix-turn-helix transcriptional regulator n=1 Tax=Streptosporangium sp. NPDC051023 TaxID=3155410 RepID=UPI00344BB28E